jgi:hypothetical protein
MLRISFEIASSCVNTPFPAFLEVCKTALEITSWNAAEPFYRGRLNGRNVIIPMAFQSSLQSWEYENNNLQVTNLAHATIQ